MKEEFAGKSLDDLAKMLDSLDQKQAIGELVVRLIKSNLDISKNLSSLMGSLERSSTEATRVSKLIMYLTTAIALSAGVLIIEKMSFLLDFIPVWLS
jgi:hypothetical protein